VPDTWDLVVTNPDGTAVARPAAFVIEDGRVRNRRSRFSDASSSG
jgi:hypothetical protein